MTVPPLPPELTDRIIRDVDHRTLPACALVCRSWIPASRYALFREARVRNSTSDDLLVSRVLLSESMRPYLSFVRKMKLQDGHGLDTLRSPWFSFFQHFAGQLPNLTVLVLGVAHWEQYSPHPNTPLLLSTFTSVQVLELRHCEFPSFGFLCRTLSALPSLATLTVEVCTWPEPSPALMQNHLPHGTFHPDRPRLTKVYLFWEPFSADRLRAQQLVRWLASSATSFTLSSFDFMVFARDGCRADHGFVDFFGPFFPALLRSVSDVGMGVMESTEDHPYLFSTASEIKTIGMGINPDKAATWTTLVAMFRSLLPSVRLDRVTLDGIISLPAEAILDGLELLDDIFEDATFSALKVVAFGFHYCVDPAIDRSTVGEELLQTTQGKLPKLFAQKRIDICVRVREMGDGYRMTVFDYSSHRGQ